jgi:hypothetical protein
MDRKCCCFTMTNLLHTKKLWWALTPLKWLNAIKSTIESIYKNHVWNLVNPPETWCLSNVNGSIKKQTWMFTSIKVSTCQKCLYDKVQKVDYNKIGSANLNQDSLGNAKKKWSSELRRQMEVHSLWDSREKLVTTKPRIPSPNTNFWQAKTIT